MQNEHEDYTGSILEILSYSGGARLAYRPKDIKFDETRATLDVHCKQIEGLSVGDLVEIVKRDYHGMDNEKSDIRLDWQSNTNAYMILGFMKLTGKMRGVLIKEYFCILAEMIGKSGHIIREVKNNNQIGKIALFSMSNLKKAENER